ncbi:hypothetical protein Tco_0140995 [Tanacetum coccineum]
MYTTRKMVRAPFTLLPSIEAAIAKEISAPPRKRTRSPSPPPSPSPSPPLSPSPLPSPPLSPSSPPSPSSSLSPPSRDTLPPRKRFKMTSPHPDMTDETMVEIARPYRRLDAHRWEWIEPMLTDWGAKDRRFEVGWTAMRDRSMLSQHHMDELPPKRFDAMEQKIDEFYPNSKVARQEKDATLDALELARGRSTHWSPVWRREEPKGPILMDAFEL